MTHVCLPEMQTAFEISKSLGCCCLQWSIYHVSEHMADSRVLLNHCNDAQRVVTDKLKRASKNGVTIAAQVPD